MTSHRILSWTPAAIVFDCDGTLMDTERHWEVARELTINDFGVGTAPDFAQRTKGLHYTECGRLMAEEAGRPELGGQLTERLLSRFRALVAESPKTMPGAQELVANAAKFAPLAVASNCPLEVVEECLTTANLRHFFDHVVVPDSTARPKPDPDLYLAAARYCGAAPADTLAVEDSYCGVQSATRAGLRVLGVGPWPGEEIADMVDLWVATLDEPRIFEWASERVARHLHE
ncbi:MULTISPECIES: HAD family hydrolase [unclassified Streptomyces]|uniref:HAD family hydrolase n=1 Tax=unclassified Streptomyces TaxID=2593676 RepID=UPI002E350702|nr:HAD family phosphatase [Streptomyces sp. NBC_01477]